LVWAFWGLFVVGNQLLLFVGEELTPIISAVEDLPVKGEGFNGAITAPYFRFFFS